MLSVQWCKLDKREPSQSLIELQRVQVKDWRFMQLLWQFFPFTFRIQGDRNPMLIQVCKERKWKVFGDMEEQTLPYLSWNLWWITSANRTSRASSKLNPWQSVNFIPNATSFCRKDFLGRYLKRMKAVYGSAYDFGPTTFNLPADYTNLINEHRHRKKECEKVVWIAKPIAKSQGRGIFIFEKCSALRYGQPYVVQEYLQNPYLINGYKWDLRLYVLIACRKPLRIYAYEEGIVRFATKKYTLFDLSDHYAHLTNTSINKTSPWYLKRKDNAGEGSKWTFRQLRTFFKSNGIEDYLLWQEIWSILVLTIIGDGQIICLNQEASDVQGFQFLGFDVMICDPFKPYLLEVNIHPSLSSDPMCPVDDEVKMPMLHEMFDLLGFPDGSKIPRQHVESYNILETQCDLASKILDSLMEDGNGRTRHLNITAGQSRSRTPNQSPLRATNSSPQPLKNNILGDPIGVNRKSFKGFASSNLSTGSGSRQNARQAVLLRTPGPLSNVLLNSGSRQPRNQLDVDWTVNSEPPVDANNNELLPTSRYLSLHQPRNMPGGFKGVIIADSMITQTLCEPPVSIRIPTSLKSRRKLTFPLNGPGLTLSPRDWKEEMPAECGKWVRIFPFDETTVSCSSFVDGNDIHDSVNRINEHLRAVLRLTKSNKGHQDTFYDEILGTKLNTKIWHPSF